MPITRTCCAMVALGRDTFAIDVSQGGRTLILILKAIGQTDANNTHLLCLQLSRHICDGQEQGRGIGMLRVLHHKLVWNAQAGFSP